MEPVINDENENEQTDTDQDRQTDTDRTDGEDSVVTPSQSRSPSVHPIEDDTVDVFDGYSFKGRHSVILDDDIDEDQADEEDEDEEDDSVLEEEEEEEEVSQTASSIAPVLEASKSEEILDVSEIPAEVAEYIANAAAEENAEPKTPEARPVALPASEPPVAAEQKTEASATPRTSQDATSVESATVEQAVPPATAVAQEAKQQAKANKPLAAGPRPQTQLKARSRREKSGIPALDRDLSDANYEDDGTAERDEDDDDWDFVETNVTEEHNGAKATSLFARGVVDRYKLAVFRKSTPRRSTPRTFSGMSTESDLFSEPSESPTPSEKQRRGRTPGLTFRKHPKQFLRKDAPPPSRPTSTTAKTLNHSTSLALSASSTVSSAGLLTPSPSGGSSLPMSPSLKSKESAISMGSPSESSDQSVNDEVRVPACGDTIKGTSGPSIISEGEEKQKNKVLKKYKEGAEKVLSIFQSSPNHNR